MVSFINKYIDVKKLSKKVKRGEVQSLCAFFLNDYSLRASKLYNAINKFKRFRSDFDNPRYLYTNPSSFFKNESKSEEELENEELLKKLI